MIEWEGEEEEVTGVWGEFAHYVMYTCVKVSLYNTVPCLVNENERKCADKKGSCEILYDEYNERIQ